MELASFLAPLPLDLRRHGTIRTSLPRRRRQLVASVSHRMADSCHTSPMHPVLQILRHRLNTGSKPGRRKDSRKVALCIEGGGMRGAVSAGMAAAIKYVGVEDTFDVVYGSSAGAIVGAYFVSRQVPMYGAQIYYDTICSIPENGQRFIDLWALRHHPYLRIAKDKRRQYYSDGARPVLLLDRLIDDVMREQRPLDWDAFMKTHASQPLKPVASSLLEMRAHKLDSFSTRDEFLECLRASARVPGIAGNPVEINGDLYTDGLMFEPIPYRSALQDGCTDVLVLRTRPDSASLKNVKAGIYEKHIARPYFERVPSFTRCAKLSDYLISGHHIALYNNDVRRLQTENVNPRSLCDTAIFSITPPPGAPEVGQLESRAKHVYEGVRSGFTAAYNALSPFAVGAVDLTMNSKEANGKEERKDLWKNNPGLQAARWVFPDEELVRVQERHKSLRKKAVAVGKERARAEKKMEPVEKKKVPRRRFWRMRRNGNGTSGAAPEVSIPTGGTSIEEHYFVG